MRRFSSHGRYRARAPLRLGLAGGGTDLSPYSDAFGGAVLNMTISRFAYASLEWNGDQSVKFRCRDLQCEEILELAPAFLLNEGLRLHRAVYNHVVKNFNDGVPLSVEVSSHVDSPPGSGLGSSSTLVVALLAVYLEALNITLGPYDLARVAHTIERTEAQLPGGKQDQYAASFGGLNFIEFATTGEAIVNQLRVARSTMAELESSILLHFIGTSRHSEHIIQQQIASVDGSLTGHADDSALKVMHSLKTSALQMKNALMLGQIDLAAEALRASWELKKCTAMSISNPRIERAIEIGITRGAKAAKISGAGGGGYLLFLIDPMDKWDVINGLKNEDGITSSCHFFPNGVQTWRV